MSNNSSTTYQTNKNSDNGSNKKEVLKISKAQVKLQNFIKSHNNNIKVANQSSANAD